MVQTRRDAHIYNSSRTIRYVTPALKTLGRTIIYGFFAWCAGEAIVHTLVDTSKIDAYTQGQKDRARAAQCLDAPKERDYPTSGERLSYDLGRLASQDPKCKRK